MKRFSELRKKYASQDDVAARELAAFHKAEADFLWPRQDRASAYRTAHHYNLAWLAASEGGEEGRELAVRYAHFAGHRYRQLDEFAAAGEAYEASAGLARDHESEWQIRSARRAIGCWAEVAEYEKARAVAVKYLLEWPARR